MDGGDWWAAVHGVVKSRTRLNDFTFTHWRRKWQPTLVFLPGESQGWGAWWAAIYGVAQSRTRLKRLSSKAAEGKGLLMVMGREQCLQGLGSFFSNSPKGCQGDSGYTCPTLLPCSPTAPPRALEAPPQLNGLQRGKMRFFENFSKGTQRGHVGVTG